MAPTGEERWSGSWRLVWDGFQIAMGNTPQAFADLQVAGTAQTVRGGPAGAGSPLS
jgi:hypothetical protein